MEVYAAMTGYTELSDAQKALSQAAELDNILIGISSLFIDATIENFDEKIDESLKRIGKHLMLDRCSFGHLTEDRKEMIVTNVWNKIEVPRALQSYPVDDYAWLLSPFKTGESLLWHHSDGMPNCSKNEKTLLKESGMQTFAGVPVSVDGSLVSCLGFSRISCQDNWDSMTTERFPLIASIFGQLIKRKQSDLELHNAFDEGCNEPGGDKKSIYGNRSISKRTW